MPSSGMQVKEAMRKANKSFSIALRLCPTCKVASNDAKYDDDSDVDFTHQSPLACTKEIYARSRHDRYGGD